MIILNKKLEPIAEPDVEAYVREKLIAMGFKDTDTIQVNL